MPRTHGSPLTISDAAWSDVLTAMDRTYSDLVDHQNQLEAQNAELEAVRFHLHSALQAISDVLIVAGRSGQIEEVSASLCDRSGQSRAALVGQPLADLFCEDDRARLCKALEDAGLGRTPQHLEAGLKGVDEVLELAVAPRLDDRGRVAGLVVAGRPVSELRRAYTALESSHAALKSAQAQLVRNEKLASLGRLLAGVAHELNNPISFVYANTHALERYASKFETYFQRVQAGAERDELIALRESLRLDREVMNLRDAVRGARDGAERVRDIVEDLRRLSSDGSGETSDFDLVETVHVAVNWVLRGARHPVPVTFHGAQTLMVRGRPGHIQQVAMNLVQNAVDALEGIADPRIDITHSASDTRATVSVCDNGPGIGADLRQAIFDPFFTTKPVGRGTGLGLSISHKIIEEHGGDLRLIDSEAGANFALDLPLAQGGT
ncbi:MAG: histidine kinase dimerization/phospho-acceptor domain-containing protein [Paracoccus sp. (in: a-proteobacteria)]|nr:histidine kinase dimerization/phospho-acceptor domain-containing protein [Paracoccus sp. (in: a-proteobacteria)]